MESILGKALSAFDRHSGWIIWNLFLAFIPLALSFGYSGAEQIHAHSCGG